ncbi:Type 1 glutamine amidotransferase-like domain-containing protein [Mesobacillus subterraneus]|uniref:Type 1 glutamine amidotransferase-like domain-containing protein n=1 Tax=Mesobacillus subterraneus TaxID=285983 RepID=UPI001CFEAE71|nr:Type 1 glutamine amidotransferase-like domain-containing protein [Mesobacillus subterraneus]WLR57505.1 Type 1 glutamine amidotransferase-like domain-containing protein [Mesobacillus subterraneus]
MSKLVLLSDLRNNASDLKSKVKNLLGPQFIKLAYIPSRTDKEREYFAKARADFLGLGVTDLFYFDVDEEFESSQLEDFRSCDAIFLSGGNTYQFLKNLKERNIDKNIKEMVNEGKPLIGVSAGSIIMSKSIKIAAFQDENEVELHDLSGLGVVDFEFMPHRNRENHQFDSLLKYSLLQDEIIYTCHDGEGIVIEGDEIEFYGDIKKVRNGALV